MGHKRRRFFGRKQAAILNALYHMNNEQRVALLRKADSALVRYISECALNLLRGNAEQGSQSTPAQTRGSFAQTR